MKTDVSGGPNDEIYLRRNEREVTVSADRPGALGSYPLLSSNRAWIAECLWSRAIAPRFAASF